MKLHLLTNIKLLWYWVEIKYVKLVRIFGIIPSTDCIPKGMYCYEHDKERSIKEPLKDGEYWIKICKYHRSTQKTKGIACTYIGYMGFDPSLYDQCKICNIKEPFENNK